MKHSPLAFLTLSLLALPARPTGAALPAQPPAPKPLALRPCAAVPGLPAGARCGTYEVFENRAARKGRNDGLSAECAADPACAAAFPKLREETAAVLDRVAREPVRVELPDPDTGQPMEIRLSRNAVAQTLRYMLYVPAAAVQIPLEVHLSDVPSLLISGQLDPVTPASDGEEVARHLSHSRHVVVPGGGHGLNGMKGLECLTGLITQLIEKGSVDGLDTACAAKMERPPFQLRIEAVRKP